jgi:hypothetical protein
MLPASLTGLFAGALAAALDGAFAAALVGAFAAMLEAGLTGCATSFLPRPSSATGLRGPWLDVVGEDALIYFWSRNLLGICCIQDLFL